MPGKFKAMLIATFHFVLKVVITFLNIWTIKHSTPIYITNIVFKIICTSIRKKFLPIGILLFYLCSGQKLKDDLVVGQWYLSSITASILHFQCYTFYWLGLCYRLRVVCDLSKNKIYFQLLLLLNLLDYSSTGTQSEPIFIFVVVYIIHNNNNIRLIESIQTSY